MKKKSSSKRRSTKKAKKSGMRDLQPLESSSRKVAGGKRHWGKRV